MTGIADTKREADNLRRTIESVPDDRTQPDLARLLEWARVRLAALDQDTLPEAIQRHLVEHNLFPEPDDLHDPEGEPAPQKNYWD